MLPKVHRLRARNEFKRALTAKRIFSCRYFFVVGLPAHTGHPPASTRFGFIVSKKVHKRAVQRNRIRRRLKELVRFGLKSLPSPVWGSYRALIIIAKSDCVSAEFLPLKVWMERLWQTFRP